jgi:hypothetical protein
MLPKQWNKYNNKTTDDSVAYYTKTNYVLRFYGLNAVRRVKLSLVLVRYMTESWWRESRNKTQRRRTEI